MPLTILVAGATGNTGRGAVETLSKLRATSHALSNHQIIALTRSSQSSTAQQLAKLPGVQVVEKNWVDITADWLKEHSVVRAFIASHNNPNQFAEESTFHVAALNAGVEYVVRISTTAPNVRPDSPAYYARAHWAIESMLSSPEFNALQWTSLQANMFSEFCLASASEFIKRYRETGVQGTLRLILSEDAPVGMIDAPEVGIFAAHLLAQADPAVHDKARYVVNGPEDINGRQIVRMVEEYIGARVENISYKDLSDIFSSPLVQDMAKNQSANVIRSIEQAPVPDWEGECTASTTSKEVLEIAAPKRTPAQVLRSLLED